MNNTKAVYPGTFDPLTYGHLDIIRRAVNMFGEVTVLLAQNLSKNTYFTIDERITIAATFISFTPKQSQQYH